MKVKAVILAAGEGKRMKSDLPKPLHRLCGRPLVQWAMASVSGCDPNPVVVVGHGAEQVKEALASSGAAFAEQREQKGTGHAVMMAREQIADADAILVVAGDMPLIRPETIAALVEGVADGNDITMLTVVAPNPTGYGRVLRNETGAIVAIVEQRDATPAQQCICEVNTSVYCFRRETLFKALGQLKADNAQGELYLTDAIKLTAEAGGTINAVQGDFTEGMGINDRAQLAEAAAVLRARINRTHLLNGVTLIDPQQTYIDWDVRIGRDTVVYPGNTLETGTVIGEGCTLYPGSRIAQSTIGNDVEITSSVITETTIGDHCHIGPFAYTRPGSRIGSDVKIGDFVEIKNATIGDDTKISHLTYVGDADVGRNVNLGCGVVFSNYDGQNKYRSTVEDGAFIGCNTNLVSPVHVGKNAYTAAGSTITEDIPDDALAIARSRQTNKEGWVTRRKGGNNK